MKNLIWIPIALAVAFAVVYTITPANLSGGPQPGETVQPVIGTPSWRAGSTHEIAIRLEAVNGDSGNARLLQFTGIPSSANPVASVAFYNEETLLSEKSYDLSHRC
ncbi:MAG: hypothetical protein ACFCD0_19395 [Gemmataceae bacterium]